MNRPFHLRECSCPALSYADILDQFLFGIDTDTSAAMNEDTSTHVNMPAVEPSPELTIDTFDELILKLSFAILQLVQNIEDGDEAQLHSAVTDAQQKIRDHYIATSEMKNIAALHEIAKENPGVVHQRLLVAMEGHKAEADGLRLSLHERSESLIEAIRQGDEVTETKNAFVRSLANEKRQRGEENVQLKAFKTEVDRLNAEALHATAYNAFTVGKMEQALKDADAAITYKKTILKTLERADRDRAEARAERDVAREERKEAVRDKWIILRRLEELENQKVVYEQSSVAVERQLLAVEKPQVVLPKQHVVDEEEAEKAKARRVAFEVLSSKYNERKRKGPSGEEISRIPTT